MVVLGVRLQNDSEEHKIRSKIFLTFTRTGYSEKNVVVNAPKVCFKKWQPTEIGKKERKLYTGDIAKGSKRETKKPTMSLEV